jgi:hypothetical protein
MDTLSSPGNPREAGIFNEVMALYGAPAYVRRARNMEMAWEALVERHRRRRREDLAIPSMLLAVLRALAGEWKALRPWLADDTQPAVLESLEVELRPTLRQPLQATRAGRKLRRALRELVDSLERFNHRWTRVLQEADFGAVNELRAGYNRFYVLEKECVVRSPHVARLGFKPVSPASVADLAAVLPPLPVPRLS